MGCRSGGFIAASWDTQGSPEREHPLVQGSPQAIRDSPPRRDLVRTLKPVGLDADGHDLQFLGTDHLVGSKVPQSHVDTSAYGGSSDATVKNTELQEVSSGGQLVWDWKSQDHIALAETGRWWPRAIDLGYDIIHWNSIQPVGNSVIASFRHLDAVYKIDKSSGAIIWKLGGTSRPASLERDRGSIRVHVRRPTRCPPAARWDPDRVRQPQLSDAQPATARSALSDRRANRNRDSPTVDHRPRCSRLPLLRLGAALRQR